MRSAPTATLLLVASVLIACSDTTPNHPAGVMAPTPASAKVGIPTVVVNSLRADVPGDVPCTPALCTMVQAVASVPSGGMVTFSPNLCAGAPSCQIPGGHYLVRYQDNGEEAPFSVTINGPSGYSLAITNAASSSLFTIASKTHATIRNLTIRDGFQPGTGGSLGGGVSNHGIVFLENVIVRDNQGTLGGGIYTEGGVVEVRNSQVVDNEGFFGGGGIHANGGRVTLVNTVVRGNRVTNGAFPGGGFSSPGASSLTLLKKSCISNNEPDDISTAGTVTGTNCQ